MALSPQGNRIPPLAAAVCSALLLAAFGLATLAPVQAAPTANPIANCEVHIDGEDFSPTKLAKTKGGDSGTSFNKAKITACDTEIVAKHAHGTSLDFDDSTWTFTGDVHIRLGEQQARLTSEQAVVKFGKSKEVEQVTFKGDPAEFEQKRPKSEGVTRGHAKNIVYESRAGTITLQDDVWLSDCGREFKGPSLVYDIRNAEVSKTGRSGDGEQANRVHITINPAAAKDPKDDCKKPAPTPP